MQKLDDFKIWLMFSVASLLVPFAYEFRAQNEKLMQDLAGVQVPPILVAIVLFVFGLTIARVSANFLIRRRFVRKWILGSKFVEGYWLIETTPAHEGDDSLERLGIVYMRYMVDAREFKVDVTRYEGNLRYITQSEVAYVRTSGSTIRYLNFFNLTHPNPNGVNGFSSGRFAYGDHFSKVPQHFSATISLQDSGFIGEQLARKISESDVKKYRKNHGEDWMKVYIDEVENCKAQRKINEEADVLADIANNPDISSKENESALKEASRK